MKHLDLLPSARSKVSPGLPVGHDPSPETANPFHRLANPFLKTAEGWWPKILFLDHPTGLVAHERGRLLERTPSRGRRNPSRAPQDPSEAR